MKGYDLRMKGDELRKEIVQTIHDLLTDNNIKEYNLDEPIGVNALYGSERIVMDVVCVCPDGDTLHYKAVNEDGDVCTDNEHEQESFTIDLDSLTVILMDIEECVEIWNSAKEYEKEHNSTV